MNTLRSVLYVVSFLLIQACSKDKSQCFKDCSIDQYTTPSVNNEVLDYTFLCQSPIGWQFTYPGRFGTTNPSFNPRNPSQVCFLQRDSMKAPIVGLDLCTFDFCTGEKRLLTGGAHDIGSPDWGINDWIVFTGADLQIWKVKSNGDSLVRITSDQWVHGYPVWSLSGARLLFKSDQVNVLAFEDGVVYDTVIGGPSVCWINDSVLCAAYGSGTQQTVNVVLYNSNTESTESLLSVPMNNSSYMPDGVSYNKATNTIFWSSPVSVNKLNLSTNHNVEIKQGGDNRGYGSIRISPIGDEVAINRWDNIVVQNCLIATTFSIHVMNADGSNERRLNVDVQ